MPFIPYVNVAVAFAFLWIPHGFCLYVKSQRLRKQDELYDRLVSRTWVVLQPILLSLYALGWLAGVIAIILAIWGKGS
jgi:hypothetical protein